MRARQGPVDTLVPEPPQRMRLIKSELNKMLGEVRVYLSSIKVPSILLDVQSVFVKLTKRASISAVVELLERVPRVVLIENKKGLFSTDAIFEFFRRIRPFAGDIYEVCVWKEQIEVYDQIVEFTQTLDRTVFISWSS
jgi:glyceraldehyde-3-phosphate dehydrogenase (NAD(P))